MKMSSSKKSKNLAHELIHIKPDEFLKNVQIYLPVKASVILQYTMRGNLSEIAEAMSLMRQSAVYEQKQEIKDWIKYGIFIFLVLIGLGALYIIVAGISGSHSTPPSVPPTTPQIPLTPPYGGEI